MHYAHSTPSCSTAQTLPTEAADHVVDMPTTWATVVLIVVDASRPDMLDSSITVVSTHRGGGDSLSGLTGPLVHGLF